MRRNIVPPLLLCLIALPLAAQAPSITAQQEAMRKLDFMAGKWKGEGWHERVPGKRETFVQTENVQTKLVLSGVSWRYNSRYATGSENRVEPRRASDTRPVGAGR